MATEKEDHRIRVTKSIIKEAFFTLLKKEPMKDVSVKELCAEANINRSTFYFHYTDVYDLLDKIEEEMLDDFKDLLDTSKYDIIYLTTSIYLEVFKFVEKHQEMCEILIVKNADPAFLKKIVAIGHDKYMLICTMLNPKVDKEKLEYFYVSIVAGYLGIMGRWIENGMKESAIEVAEIAKEITTKGINVIS